jgi:hypothetical protein
MAGCPVCSAAPPAPAPAPIPQIALPSVTSAEASGFIAALFDLSFTSFITTKLIKVLYVLGIAGAALWALAMAGTGIAQGGVSLVLVLISPILFLIGVIYMRVMMELIMVLFRAAEHLAEIARQGRR